MPAAAAVPLDDAGKPLPIVPAGTYVQHTWGERMPARVILARVMPWLGWIGTVLLLWYVNYFTVTRALSIAGLAAVFVLVHLATLRIASRRNRPPLPSGVAWTAAHRRCGCCAYPMRDLTPDAHGLSTCPECGATWHSDRWTLADRDFREASNTRALMTAPAQTDDRGVWLDRHTAWPPAWTAAGRASGTATEAIRRAIVAGRWRRLAVGLPIIALAWAITTSLGVWLADPSPREFWRLAMAIGLILALIGLAVAWLLYRVDVPWFRQRAMILHYRACPCCGAALGGLVPQFDQCVACIHCGRAWACDPAASRTELARPGNLRGPSRNQHCA